jgi:hypothetical protein
VFVEQAITACELHDTDHVEHDDPTVAACLDADLLLLPRVGIKPDVRLLATDAARRHAAGARRLMMPEADEPMVWSQLWLIAERLRRKQRGR